MKFFAVITTLLIFKDSYIACEARIKITVFYETYCPWSKELILEQVQDTNNKLGQYIKWDLVPYGFQKEVTVYDDTVNICQHGSGECKGNKVHACILNQAFSSQDNKLKMIYCTFHTKYRKEEIKTCADSIGFDQGSLNDCINGERGELLLLLYGARTDILGPESVPYVLYNGYTNSTLSNTTDIFTTTCKIMSLRPEPCKKLVIA